MDFTQQLAAVIGRHDLSDDQKLAFLQSLHKVLNDPDFVDDKADFQLAERKVFDELTAPYFDRVDQRDVKDDDVDFVAVDDAGLTADMFRDVVTSDKLDLKQLAGILNDTSVTTNESVPRLRFGQAVGITESSLYRCTVHFKLSTDGAGLERFYPVDQILHDFGDEINMVIPLKCATLFTEQMKRTLPGRYSAVGWTPDGRAIAMKLSADVADVCRFLPNVVVTDPDGKPSPYSTSVDLGSDRYVSLYADDWRIVYDGKEYRPHEFLVFMRHHL